MRRWLGNVVRFAALLGLGHLALLLFAANAPPEVQAGFRKLTNVPPVAALRRGSTMLRFREIETQGDIDILFAGSSHCYRAFDTRIYAGRGYRAFNMGSTAQTPLNTYYLLRRHLGRLRPDLLIVEVYWGTLAADGVESLLDLSANLPLTPELWRMALATRDLRAVNAVGCRALDLRSGPLDDAPVLLASVDEYHPGGFVERRPGFRSAGAPVVGVGSRRPPNPVQLDYLARIIDLARRQGARVALVMQPVTLERQRRLPNLPATLQVIESFAAEQGVAYLDLNSWMSLNDAEHFYDYHHLNQTGVALFNERLLEELEARDLLPRAG